MKGLSIFIRTTKKTGSIKLRFRLRDGRNVDLYHKSNIRADLKDLTVFTPEGDLRPRVSVYNRELKTLIDTERLAIERGYLNLCGKKDKATITQEEFEKAIECELYPERNNNSVRQESTLLERFLQYIDDGVRDGLFQKARFRHYKVVYRILQRFLLINQMSSITTRQFTADVLIDFRRFIIEEYLYVAKYPSVYDSVETRKIPDAKRSQNTAATKLKMIHTFFNDMVERGELDKSPFDLVGKQRKRVMMREQYDEPVCLTLEEFERILEKDDMPQALQETRDCFLLQCAFGCRISDFMRLSMKKVDVNEDGIPYIHYVALKTVKNDHEEKSTPIMRYALDIIKKWEFRFPILKYVSGKSGYNAKIKQLLKYCGIDRLVTYFDPETNDNKRVPLYEVGSSKLCRKTFVDLINKMQINMYLGGLHKEGSDAVKRYTNIGLKERFILYSVAFNQPVYTVDKELNIIKEGEM